MHASRLFCFFRCRKIICAPFDCGCLIKNWRARNLHKADVGNDITEKHLCSTASVLISQIIHNQSLPQGLQKRTCNCIVTWDGQCTKDKSDLQTRWRAVHSRSGIQAPALCAFENSPRNSRGSWTACRIGVFEGIWSKFLIFWSKSKKIWCRKNR